MCNLLPWINLGSLANFETLLLRKICKMTQKSSRAVFSNGWYDFCLTTSTGHNFILLLLMTASHIPPIFFISSYFYITNFTITHHFIFLDDYINDTTRKMITQSVTGNMGRVSVLAQIQCIILGLQNVYFEYQNKMYDNIQASVNSPMHFNPGNTHHYPIANNSQEISYINNVLCLEFNSEYRSCWQDLSQSDEWTLSLPHLWVINGSFLNPCVQHILLRYVKLYIWNRCRYVEPFQNLTPAIFDCKVIHY